MARVNPNVIITMPCYSLMLIHLPDVRVAEIAFRTFSCFVLRSVLSNRCFRLEQCATLAFPVHVTLIIHTLIFYGR